MSRDMSGMAAVVIERVGAGKDKGIEFYGNVKTSLWDLLVWAGTQVRDVFAEMQDEDEFLNLLACIGDRLIDAGWLEFADGPALLAMLKLLDKQVIDRFFGTDWFVKLKAAVLAVTDTTPPPAAGASTVAG